MNRSRYGMGNFACKSNLHEDITKRRDNTDTIEARHLAPTVVDYGAATMQPLEQQAFSRGKWLSRRCRRAAGHNWLRIGHGASHAQRTSGSPSSSKQDTTTDTRSVGLRLPGRATRTEELARHVLHDGHPARDTAELLLLDLLAFGLGLRGERGRETTCAASSPSTGLAAHPASRRGSSAGAEPWASCCPGGPIARGCGETTSWRESRMPGRISPPACGSWQCRAGRQELQRGLRRQLPVLPGACFADASTCAQRSIESIPKAPTSSAASRRRAEGDDAGGTQSAGLPRTGVAPPQPSKACPPPPPPSPSRRPWAKKQRRKLGTRL
ncbi:unnamed protein product, partial [Prorocentrum cordatum]